VQPEAGARQATEQPQPDVAQPQGTGAGQPAAPPQATDQPQVAVQASEAQAAEPGSAQAPAAGSSPAGSQPEAATPQAEDQQPAAPKQPEAATPSVNGQQTISQDNRQPEPLAPLPQPRQQETLPQRGQSSIFQESGQLPVANGRPAAPPSSLPSRKPHGADAPRQEEVTAEWNFGTDEGWRAVQAVSQSTPSTFTSAGLPRRRRGEQLLPGSAGPPTGATAPRPQRDAHDVRGRLRSFQQGIERGRHRTAQAAETNHETMEGE
jgi:hypothetical protein